MAVLSPVASLETAEASFLALHPDYRSTSRIDDLRRTEYRRLDELGSTYLDYAGGGIYAESQLAAHHELLSRNVFGNPHSGNPASRRTTDLVEQTRHHVLDFFNAPADEYVAIFTPNATAALKLVGEAYPFGTHGRYLLTADNHNSVNGIREFARRSGAAITYAPLTSPELRVQSDQLQDELDRPSSGSNLFAFPAQSNFSGVQHDLRWIDVAHARGWDVLLDAAAFAPTNRLDLRQHAADFVSMSFYKMCGYPTGSGALLARKDALARLERPWFSGGTIAVSSVQAPGDGYSLLPGAAGFEDGTVNYVSMPAVDLGLRWIEHVGLDAIHTRTLSLTGWLLAQLAQLCHQNGRPLVHIYGPSTTADRGATVALNILDPDGSPWNCWDVEAMANARNLSLRAGCHCNPGAREAALEISLAESASYFAARDRLSFEAYTDSLRDHLSGVVRVSLGIASTFADVYRFLEFVRDYVDRAACRGGTLSNA